MILWHCQTSSNGLLKTICHYIVMWKITVGLLFLFPAVNLSILSAIPAPDTGLYILSPDPIEMVSPVLKFDPGSQWRSSVQQFWDTMRRISFIKTNRTCGTHVHLSPPKGQSWDIHWVKCICRTAIYFEEAIEVLVPPPRRGNEYCRSNSVDNPLLHGKPLGEIFDLIEACSNIPDVVRLLNPDTRDYAFNFRNLDSSLSSRPQTVEFRRPPGVTTAAECLSWTQFTVSFIMGGASSGTTTQLSQYSRDVNGLKKFIEASSVPGALESQLMSPIFENKSGSLKITPYRDLANETKEA